MPTEYQAPLPPTAPSTAKDGYDISLEEALAMSTEDFTRAFGHASLDEVPCVHPDHLPRAPKGCQWYVRFRKAPQNPGPRDQKVDSFQMVVKGPLNALPEAGGDVAVKPRIIGLQAKSPAQARLEALIFLARAQGRTRRATEWTVAQIQDLNVKDVLDGYIEAFLAVLPKTGTPRLRRNSIRAFQRTLPELQVGDVNELVVTRYLERSERARLTKLHDLFVVRMALKEGLKLLGVPPTYNVHFRIPDPKMLPKVAWTPAEFDRLRAAADGFVHNADGSPKLVAGPCGPLWVRRCGGSVWPAREAWRRAIPFLAYTASRAGRLPPTRWVPPEAEPMDGKPLPINDRPWIEVMDHAIFYHRDGEARYDGNKRRGVNRIPVEFEPTVRRWYRDDLAEGWEWVFHKRDGSRYLYRSLPSRTWRSIVEDAGIDPGRVPHHLKDLAVDWSDGAGLSRETLAAHADTTARTLAQKYGDPCRAELIDQAAEKMTQGDWRARGERKAGIAALFREARDQADAAVAPATGRRRGSAAG